MAETPVVEDVGIAAAWNVQGDPSRGAFLDEASRQFRVTLPLSPNTTTRGDRSTAFWLGPRSWLIVADDPAALADFTQRRDALHRVGGALFDLSASRVAFRVCGPHATAILASACPLDFDARSFAAGACAQSLFGRVNALVHKVDDRPTFVMMVARSFALDVRRGLATTAAQYG